MHIVPGTGSYGNAVFGLHLYAWAFFAFALTIIGCAIMMLDDRQFARTAPMSARLRVLPLSALLLFMALVVANIFSTVALCGGGRCPANPADYIMFATSPV